MQPAVVVVPFGGMSLGQLLEELRILGASGVPATAYQWGPHAEQWGDLRLPPDVARPPVAVLFHGGFWRSFFGRSIMDALAADLVVGGWASWNVEYRRAGSGGGVPQTWDDAVSAVRFLDSVDSCLDLSRVVTIGHSAGAHLALWCASSAPVAAVVSLAGVCDLTAAAADELDNGAVAQFIGGTPSQRPGDYAAADLTRRLPAGVPQLIVHGTADDRVPIEYSRAYAAAARAAGDPCELLELVGVDHFAFIDPRTPAWHTVLHALNPLPRHGEGD